MNVWYPFIFWKHFFISLLILFLPGIALFRLAQSVTPEHYFIHWVVLFGGLYLIYFIISAWNFTERKTEVQYNELAFIIWRGKLICRADEGWHIFLLFWFFRLRIDDRTVRRRIIPTPTESRENAPKGQRIEKFTESPPIKITHAKTGGDERNPLARPITTKWRLSYGYELVEEYYKNFIRRFKDLEELDKMLADRMQATLKSAAGVMTFTESMIDHDGLEKILLLRSRAVVQEPIRELMEQYDYTERDSLGPKMLYVNVVDIDPGPEIDAALARVVEEWSRGKGLSELAKELGMEERHVALYLDVIHKTFAGSQITLLNLPIVDKLLQSLGGFGGFKGLSPA